MAKKPLSLAPGTVRLGDWTDTAPGSMTIGMPVAPWGTLHALTPTEGAADRNTVAIDSEVVTLLADGACYWLAGDEDVAATAAGYPLPADTFIEIPMGADTHISVISATGSGNILAWIIERSW